MSERIAPGADPTEAAAEVRTRKLLHTRIMWFIAGSVVNYLLISTPFHWLSKHTDLPTWAKSSASLAVSVSFFFLWNYFINFRTDTRKRDALAKYALAVGVMYLLSSSLLTLLKHVDAHMSLTLFGAAVDLDIVATQAMLGGLKFFLYHLWVFPPVGLREGDVTDVTASKE